MTGNPLASPSQAEIRPSYRPDIDGLRAVAILSVVLYHVSDRLLPGGFVGVDIFFVISGFLISSLIFKELEQGRFHFGDFYIRRIRRIFPALVLMMAAAWIVAFLLFTEDEFVQLGEYILGGGAFVSNLLQWRLAGYFDTAAPLKPLQHLWSLGIEEQFYIVWPVAVVLLWRWKGRFCNILLGLMLASFAFNIIRTPHHAVGAFFLPMGRAWELLLGALLAWQDRYSGSTTFARDRVIVGSLAMRDVAAGLAMTLLVTSLAFINARSDFPGWWALLPTVASFLIIWAGEQAWINSRILANPAMVFIGLISYPLYIWHWPLLSFLHIVGNGEPSLPRRVAVMAVAFVLATLTYLLVERPLRHSRVSRKLIVASLASAMFVISLLGGLGAVHLIQTPGMASNEAAELAAKRAWDRTSNCGSFEDKHAASYEWCRVWGDPTLKKTYVIWGDSHAHSWSAVSATLAQQRGARLVEFSHPACPGLLDVRRITQNLGKACDTFALSEEIFGLIQKLKPQHIILVSRWSFYNHDWPDQGDNRYITADPQGAAGPKTSTIAFQTRIPQTIRGLAALAPVTVIESVPTLHSSIEAGLRRDPKEFEPTLSEYRALEAEPNAIIEQAARNIPGVRVLDPAVKLCDRKKCHAILRDVRLYEDDNTHLSDAGSLLFLPVLSEMVK